MKKYDEKQITTTNEIWTETYCDRCKKEIKINHRKDECYYHVTTHHHDWGNDSCESREEFDFCSYDCLEIHMREYFEKAKGSEEYEISRETATKSYYA